MFRDGDGMHNSNSSSNPGLKAGTMMMRTAIEARNDWLTDWLPDWMNEWMNADDGMTEGGGWSTQGGSPILLLLLFLLLPTPAHWSASPARAFLLLLGTVGNPPGRAPTCRASLTLTAAVADWRKRSLPETQRKWVVAMVQWPWQAQSIVLLPWATVIFKCPR